MFEAHDSINGFGVFCLLQGQTQQEKLLQHGTKEKLIKALTISKRKSLSAGFMAALII